MKKLFVLCVFLGVGSFANADSGFTCAAEAIKMAKSLTEIQIGKLAKKYEYSLTDTNAYMFRVAIGVRAHNPNSSETAAFFYEIQMTWVLSLDESESCFIDQISVQMAG